MLNNNKITDCYLLPVLCIRTHTTVVFVYLPSASRCWACSVPAWCCAGGVTTPRTSCWSQPTATHEGGRPPPEHSRNQKASHDMSTVDSRCSYIITRAHLAQFMIQQWTLVMWFFCFEGETSYLLTCFVSYCYIRCSCFFSPYIYWNIYSSQKLLIIGVDAELYYFLCCLIKLPREDYEKSFGA